MKKCTMLKIMVLLFVIAVLGLSWAASEEKKAKTPEEKAWEDVDSLNKRSLQDFLKHFPDGKLAPQAKLAIALQDKITNIKQGKSKADFTIPFNVLGERWKSWQQKNPDKGVIGYSIDRLMVTKLGKREELATFSRFLPHPLSGGKTSGRDTFTLFPLGVDSPTSLNIISFNPDPTGDSSIIAFSTSGLKYEFLERIIIETPGVDPIFFVVMEGKGLVHLKGAGRVTLPDGNTTDLK